MKRIYFFDLDGVLTNFIGGVLRVHGTHKPEVHHGNVQWGVEDQLGIHPDVFWPALGRAFWENLEPYEDGFELLRHAESLVGADRIGLLTSAADVEGCVDGKRAWVKKYLPEYMPRLFTGTAKHLFAGPNKVLVDDHEPNCLNFAAAGGQYVMVPRPWNPRKSEALSHGMFIVDRIAAELKL